MLLLSYVPRSSCPTAETGAFQYTIWTNRMQRVLLPHSLSGSHTLGILLSYLKIRKEATFWLQRNPDQPVDNHWFSCFYLTTFKKMITKNVENL